ncbi:ABC transporter permease [Brachybacterium huguangmaarense]
MTDATRPAAPTADSIDEPTGDPTVDPAAGPTAAQAGAPGAGRTPFQLAVRRFRRNRLAVIGAGGLVLILLACFVVPPLLHLDPYTVHLSDSRQAPDDTYRLGTDISGRDTLARVLVGGRTSILVSFTAALISVGLGTLLGAIAGTLGGVVDTLIMRAADVFLSFPYLVVIIVVAGILGPSIPVIVLAVGVFGWPGPARIVRSVTLSMRDREFVQASRAVGARTPWVITRHMLPAALGQLVVVGTLEIATYILLEAGLSFLGLGVQPPTPSWGNLLNQAQSLSTISTMWWLWVPPGLMVALTVLCVNFVGDGLRDAVDPKQG